MSLKLLCPPKKEDERRSDLKCRGYSAWYHYKMVTLNTVRACDVKQAFLKKNVKVPTAVLLKECLQEIKLPISLFTCARVSELPSDTMGVCIIQLLFSLEIVIGIQRAA